MQSAPEVETTLARLSTYRNVRGVMVLTRTRHTADTSNTSDTAVLQTTGTVFEGDGGKRYASAVESIVGGVTKALKECDESVSWQSAAKPQPDEKGRRSRLVLI